MFLPSANGFPLEFASGAAVFAAGACLGRALGQVIYRLARAAGYPASHYYALADRRSRVGRLPILGRIFGDRAGRCRRAFAIEAILGVSFLACWTLCDPGRAACGCILFLGLIGASFIDLDHMIIPDLFTIGLATAGLALSAFVPSLHGLQGAPSALHSFGSALFGLTAGSALVLWLGLLGELLLGKEIVGFGDVKFVGAIGAFCGWQGAVFSVFGGAAFGAAALAVAALHERFSSGRSGPFLRLESAGGQAARVGWGVRFPFGPMLAAGAALYFLALHPAVDRYLARYAGLF